MCYAFSKSIFYTKPHVCIAKMMIEFWRSKQSVCIFRKWYEFLCLNFSQRSNAYSLSVFDEFYHVWPWLIFLPWKFCAYFIVCWILIFWRPRSNIIILKLSALFILYFLIALYRYLFWCFHFFWPKLHCIFEGLTYPL